MAVYSAKANNDLEKSGKPIANKRYSVHKSNRSCTSKLQNNNKEKMMNNENKYFKKIINKSMEYNMKLIINEISFSSELYYETVFNFICYI